jgi:hypothetical protein
LAAIRKVLNTPPQIDPSLPAPEQSIIERCVGEPSKRYATASQLADELDRLV